MITNIETASREQLQEAVRHLLEREEAQIAALTKALAYTKLIEGDVYNVEHLWEVMSTIESALAGVEQS